jgi:hypothetical protein
MKKDMKTYLWFLTAMAQHDGRITEYFTAIKNGKKPPKQFLEVDSEYKELNVKAWNRLRRLSWRPFEEARAYVTELGVSEPEWQKLKKNNEAPADIPSNPYQVYAEYTSWYDFSGRTSPEDTLEEFIREYRNYLKKNPDNPFPKQSFITEDGYVLGNRVNGYKTKCTKEVRERILNEFPEINFFQDANELSWSIRFEAYKKYKKTNDNIPKRGTIIDDVDVGIFHDEIRERYRNGGKKYGVKKLTKIQINKLVEIGFTYESYDDAWNKTLAEYQQIFLNGDVITKKTYPKIHRWIYRQKGNKNISKEKRDKLISVNPDFFKKLT